jgi:hypothetical protein
MSAELYCGRCYYDMGFLRPLTAFRRWLEKEARYVIGGYTCSFCQSERIPGKTYLRVREVANSQTGEETSVHIPHVVSASGKVFG